MNFKALSIACVISLSALAAAGCADNDNNGNSGSNTGNNTTGTTTGQSTRDAKMLHNGRGGNGTVAPYTTRTGPGGATGGNRSGTGAFGTGYGSNGNRLFENDNNANNGVSNGTVRDLFTNDNDDNDLGRLFGMDGRNGNYNGRSNNGTARDLLTNDNDDNDLNRLFGDNDRNGSNNGLFGRNNNNEGGLFGAEDNANRSNGRGGLFGTGLFSGMAADNDNGPNDNTRAGNGYNGIRSNGAGTSDPVRNSSGITGYGVNGTTGLYNDASIGADNNRLVLGDTIIVAENNNSGLYSYRTNGNGRMGNGMNGVGAYYTGMDDLAANGKGDRGTGLNAMTSGAAGQTNVLIVAHPEAVKALKRINKNLESGNLTVKADAIVKDLRIVLKHAASAQGATGSKNTNKAGASNNAKAGAGTSAGKTARTAR